MNCLQKYVAFIFAVEGDLFVVEGYHYKSETVFTTNDGETVNFKGHANFMDQVKQDVQVLFLHLCRWKHPLNR